MFIEPTTPQGDKDIMKATNIHHIGVVVNDLDEMIAFLTEVLGFRLLIRRKFEWGERAYVHLGDNQLFEMIAKSEAQPRASVPAFGGDNPDIVGVPHICFRVEDISAMEEKIQARGYPVHYSVAGKAGSHELGGPGRAIGFTGPGGVDFAVIEMVEHPFDELSLE
jgi:catechol 2,3-dioxygenase-like lactoylglutathione lyase family enzyme